LKQQLNEYKIIFFLTWDSMRQKTESELSELNTLPELQELSTIFLTIS